MTKLWQRNLSISILFFLFILVRVWGVGNDISNSDAARWHRRSINFLSAIKSGTFEETYQRYHPGVSLMWIESFVIQGLSFYQRLFSDEVRTLENADWYPITHGVSKIILVFALFLLLLHQFFTIKKIFGFRVAFIYVFILSFEPYLVGINRWFHLSSLENFLVFSSLLSLLSWHKNGKITYKDLDYVLAAVFFGLGVLTKMSAGVMILPLVWIIFDKTCDKKTFIKYCSIFCGISFMTFFILFPALWVAPVYTLLQMVNALFGSVKGEIRETDLPYYLIPFYYLMIFVIKTSPTLLIFSIVSLAKKTGYVFERRTLMIVLLGYYIFFSLTGQKIDRYIISFFLPTILLSAVYLSTLHEKGLQWLMGAHILVFILATYLYYPVYSLYSSPIIGGPTKSLSLGLYDNSGEYFSDAALYLNDKGRDVVTIVPYNIDSFSYYYKGILADSPYENPDYLVVSLDNSRTLLREDSYVQACPQLEKSFGSRNFEAVFVYKCN